MATDTAMYCSDIGITILKYLLGILTFLSTNYALVTMVKEDVHIMILSDKYHSEAAGNFIFSILYEIFIYV